MRSTERRIAALEKACGSRERAAELLTDELWFAVLDVSRAILADPSGSEEDRAEAARIVAETEAEIREAVAAQSSDTWPGHLDYVRSMWARRGGDGEFVPSPLGFDYDGWELPGVMARRHALWERAEVAAIVRGRSTFS
jgi:hypothetical protein